MTLPAVAPGSTNRVRRWDAVILGSGLPALVTAARIGMAGQRVLLIEEEAARNSFEGLREPFFISGVRDGGMTDLALRELKIPLIDRRRMEAEDLSYQVVGPELRLNIGARDVSAEEFVAWGLCKPDDAHRLTRALHEASEAERRALLEAPFVRLGRRLGRSRLAAEGSHRRGMPAEAKLVDKRLAGVLAAQVRALSNLASLPPGPESQARLLGSSLAAGTGFSTGPPWLHGMLRQRVQSTYGEIRTLNRKFRLVNAMDQPGVEINEKRELWLGRILILATPASALASYLDKDDVPEILAGERSFRQRISVHLRLDRARLPVGLGTRAILLDDPERDDTPSAAVTLSLFPRDDNPKQVDLVARGMLGEGQDPEAREQEILDRVLALLPFHEGRYERRKIDRPRWDCDDWLEDPVRGSGWPGEMDLRLSAKPPIFSLDRSWVGGLGSEGDLLLGLRAGETLASELA